MGAKSATNGSEAEPKEAEHGGKVIADQILILLISKADGILTRHKPNFSYRLLRAVYPVFRLLFPNQVIRADELAWAMVDVVLRQTQERQGLVFENRDIRAMVESLHPLRGDPAGENRSQKTSG